MRALALAALLVFPVSPESDAPLPRTGVAVQTARGVALVGLDGRVRRTLPGFRLRSAAVQRPGQVALRDRTGAPYELSRGTVRRVPIGVVTIGRGYTLRFAGHWTLLRNGSLVRRFPRFTSLELDDSGTVLTSIRARDDGRALARPVALNLQTRARSVLPATCRVGAYRRHVRFELCGYPFAKRRPATIVRVDARGRRVLAGPAFTASHGPAGWWRSVVLSPAGDRLLAQWSGECEIPNAHVFDARRGLTGRTSVLATTRDGAAAEADVLGWAGRVAIVSMLRGACGASHDRPGVYAIDELSRPRLIYAFNGRRVPAVAAYWR